MKYTHLIKKQGLIRQDEEGPALSESAAGVLKVGKRKTEKKKKQNIKIQWRRRMVVLGCLSFPQLLLGRGVVRIRDETTKHQSTRESPGEFLSPLWASTCSTIQGRPLAWALRCGMVWL